MRSSGMLRLAAGNQCMSCVIWFQGCRHGNGDGENSYQDLGLPRVALVETLMETYSIEAGLY